MWIKKGEKDEGKRLSDQRLFTESLQIKCLIMIPSSAIKLKAKETEKLCPVPIQGEDNGLAKLYLYQCALALKNFYKILIDWFKLSLS